MNRMFCTNIVSCFWSSLNKRMEFLVVEEKPRMLCAEEIEPRKLMRFCKILWRFHDTTYGAGSEFIRDHLSVIIDECRERIFSGIQGAEGTNEVCHCGMDYRNDGYDYNGYGYYDEESDNDDDQNDENSIWDQEFSEIAISNIPNEPKLSEATSMDDWD